MAAVSDYLRLPDLRKMGFTRTDSERIMRECPRFRIGEGRYYYVRREDVDQHLAQSRAS